jgi:hypothetical protein
MRGRPLAELTSHHPLFVTLRRSHTPDKAMIQDDQIGAQNAACNTQTCAARNGT